MKSPLIRALDALKKGQSLTLSSVPDGFDTLAVADLARGLSGKIDAMCAFAPMPSSITSKSGFAVCRRCRRSVS